MWNSWFVVGLVADRFRTAANEAGLEDQRIGQAAGLHHGGAGEPDVSDGPRVVCVGSAHPKHETLEKVGARPSTGKPGAEAEAPRRAAVGHDLMRQGNELVPAGRDLISRRLELPPWGRTPGPSDPIVRGIARTVPLRGEISPLRRPRVPTPSRYSPKSDRNVSLSTNSADVHRAGPSPRRDPALKADDVGAVEVAGRDVHARPVPRSIRGRS